MELPQRVSRHPHVFVELLVEAISREDGQLAWEHAPFVSSSDIRTELVIT